MMRYLTIALTKGRLAKQTMKLLKQIGISCEEMNDPATRRLIFTDEHTLVHNLYQTRLFVFGRNTVIRPEKDNTDNNKNRKKAGIKNFRTYKYIRMKRRNRTNKPKTKEPRNSRQNRFVIHL